jgi:hypothetical protein
MRFCFLLFVTNLFGQGEGPFAVKGYTNHIPFTLHGCQSALQELEKPNTDFMMLKTGSIVVLHFT